MTPKGPVQVLRTCRLQEVIILNVPPGLAQVSISALGRLGVWSTVLLVFQLRLGHGIITQRAQSLQLFV